MRHLIILLIALSSSLAAFSQGFVAHRGTVSGAYNYWFYDPQKNGEHTPDAHFPLLIFLHGQSLCGNNLQRVKQYGAIDAIAKGRVIDTYIIAPQNPGGAWNPDKIMKIVEWAEKNYHVDSSRIYVYGMSLGGYGTIDLAATYPDRIACAMALCGGGSVKDLSGLNKVPLWIIHGTADRAVPISASDRVVAEMKRTGDASRLIYDRMAGANHGDLARVFYLRQVYDWMLSHSLDDPDREVDRSFEITKSMLKTAYKEPAAPQNGVLESLEPEQFLDMK